MKQPHMFTLLAAAERIYRVLLWVYPAEFRRRYGDEIALVFRDCCRDVWRQHGARGLAGWWLCTLVDLLTSAAAEHMKRANGMIGKRLFDLVIVLGLLIVLAPALAAIAVLIKLDSRGPVLYRDLRVGRRGRLFRMYKFRTLAIGATLPIERRITRVGRVLRAVYLDELPQLLNVLAGDMSLIGPRPPLPREVHLDDADWQRALALRPGITGASQLAYGLERGDAAAMRAIDLEYFKRRSLKMDAKLLARTFVTMMRQPKSRQ